MKHSLNFPDFYGENWDALWNCLWEYYDKSVLIEIEGFNSLSSEFITSKEKIIKIFDRGVKTLNGFSYKIIS